MKATKKVLIYALLACFVLTVAMCILRTVFTLGYYDITLREYDMEAKGVLTAFWILLIILVLCICALGIVFRKTDEIEYEYEQKHFFGISNLICGGAFVLADILALTKIGEIFSSERKSDAIYRAMTVACVFLAVPCAVYFLITASKSKRDSKARAYISMFMPLFGIALLCASYFDGDYTYADPNRKLANLAMIAALWLILTETKANTGAPHKIWRFVASLLAFSLSAIYLVPTLIALMSGIMEATGIIFIEFFEIGIVFLSLAYSINYINATNK